MIRKIYFLSILPMLMAMFLLPSCGGRNMSSSLLSVDGIGDTIPFTYARNLTMVDCGDYTKVEFRNPWDTTALLQTFYLIDADKPKPEGLPAGTVVCVPLKRSIVYTSVHAGLIDELGCLDAIAGVCDAKYIRRGSITDRVANGAISDCGLSTSPTLEEMILLHPDAILLSAYENSADHNKVAQLGIPIIDCIDYMESSPLARAEWMRFFGRLYGKAAMADSMFLETEECYNRIKNLTRHVTARPKVMMDIIYGSSWAQPTSNSTTGCLIEDAGGTNLFADYTQSGSVQVAPEEVLYRAKDADYWFVRYSSEKPFTLASLGADNPIYKQFKPFNTGNVYGCNLAYSTYYDDIEFHPQIILAEYVNILHPEVSADINNLKYYQPLQP